MARAYKLDCEAASNDCRFIIQSENEEEAISPARVHVEELHGRDVTEEALWDEHLQVG